MLNTFGFFKFEGVLCSVFFLLKFGGSIVGGASVIASASLFGMKLRNAAWKPPKFDFIFLIIFNVLTYRKFQNDWSRLFIFFQSAASAKPASARGGRSKSMQHAQDALIRNISTNTTKPSAVWAVSSPGFMVLSS